MLVFPQWRPEVHSDGCRVPRWMPAERFAPYFARPVVLPPHPPQIEDEDSLGGSSPERSNDSSVENSEGVCGWRACGARFASVARLSAHVARIHAHAHTDGLFYCGWKDCARPHRGFNARYKMLVHVRTHTNERPHTCNQCQKSFSRAENLKIHLRSHSGEKPYICPYEGCGKAYSNSSDRFKHTRTHTVDKPYCCKVPGCNKRYTDPSSLRKHVKTYKHFTSDKDIIRRDSSDEASHESLSPTMENMSYVNIPPTSPVTYNPTSIPSPTVPYSPLSFTETAKTTVNYIPIMHKFPTYVRRVEPIYPVRIPTHEMTYLDYTQMYDHAYRNYYVNSINYPVLRPTVTEKAFNFEEKSQYEVVKMETVAEVQTPSRLPMNDDMPLNLICSKRVECEPIQDLVRRTDLPLDLSTKS